MFVLIDRGSVKTAAQSRVLLRTVRAMGSDPTVSMEVSVFGAYAKLQKLLLASFSPFVWIFMKFDI